MSQNISKAIANVEGKEKIAGEAKYISDYQVNGMLYAKTVRSTVASAHIKNISCPALPDGYHIISAEDIPGDNVVKMINDDWPVFAKHKVNHIGEPIMLVVGADKRVILDIIDNIKIDYEATPGVFSFTDSIKHLSFKKGDGKKAFKHAKHVIDYTYHTGYQEQAYIEPQGFIGYPENSGVTLVGSIQCPYYVKHAVMRALALGEDDVRVKQAFVGGAFGGKEEFPSLMACHCALAVQKIQRPIKLIYEREEDMQVTTKRHPAEITMSAVIESGKIKAIKSHIGLDGGTYSGLSEVVLSRGMLAVTNAYTINHLDVSGDVYRTNTVPNGAFRGFGAPQMIFAIEMFMHHIAKELGVDPFEFRMKHLVKQGDKTATSGIFRDPIILRDMIEKATAMSDYHRKVKAYQDPNVKKGIGMSFFLHGCGFTGSGEKDKIKAKVRLKKTPDATVYILVAAVDMGQGAKTTLRKVVANVLDRPIETVIFDNPDTQFVPDSGPTVASRTMMIVGGLLARAAKTLKASWKPHDTQVIEQAYEQPKYVTWDQDKLQGDAYPAYSWGVNVVEVSVDNLSGEVKVDDVWSVYDLGKSIDDNVVLGQVDGGQAQGIAYGHLEVMRHDKGHIQHHNFTNYIIPTAADVGPTHTHIMDNPYPLGPYGAKGVGELTLVGGAPAVTLAIEMAINHTLTTIPVTPETIMELMYDA